MMAKMVLLEGKDEHILIEFTHTFLACQYSDNLRPSANHGRFSDHSPLRGQDLEAWHGFPDAGLSLGKTRARPACQAEFGHDCRITVPLNVRSLGDFLTCTKPIDYNSY